MKNQPLNPPGDTPLASFVRRRRVELGISQKELGRRIGSESGFVSRVESGARRIGINHIHVWAQALDVPERKLALILCGYGDDTWEEAS